MRYWAVISRTRCGRIRLASVYMMTEIMGKTGLEVDVDQFHIVKLELEQEESNHSGNKIRL